MSGHHDDQIYSTELAHEVRSLHAFLRDAKSEQDWHRHPLRVMFLSFSKGIAYGLGAIAAVAIVAPIVLWFLQAVSWPPIIANIVTQVIHQMERANPPGQQVPGGQ